MRTSGPETPRTRREWRSYRQQHERTRYRIRRLLLSFVLLILLLAGVFLLPAALREGTVARVEDPTVEPGPEAPAADRASSGAKPGAGQGDRPDGGAAVETQLTAENKDALRGELQRIAREYPANYGVVVYDPSTGESVKMGADQRFLAASLGKLPVLMALFKAAARGEVNLGDPISMQASDVQAYGTGVLYTYPIGYTMTLRECANFLIQKSDNTAWKMLDRYLGRDYIRDEVHGAGARSTEYWIPNTTTPNDVLVMLERISDPSYTSRDLSAEMLDDMSDTDFEDRLPQPLPAGTQVSHKIGYYGSTFADAGIVFPEGARDARDAYYIVVMASETSDAASRVATQEMSLATYRTLSKLSKPSGPDTEGKRN